MTTIRSALFRTRMVHQKKRFEVKDLRRALLWLLVAVCLLAGFAGLAEMDSEIENYTRYTDYEPQVAEPVGLIPGSDSSKLVVWFSRVGNTVFDPDVDVVSSATLQYDANGELVGNAQLAARWIAEETGADVFQIQTAYTYPSDYNQTVAVGEGQDIDQVDLRLATHLDDLGGYDTLYLCYPIWHYTLCAPLRAFLNETDLSGKAVYCFAANGGSRFADTVERIQQMFPTAEVAEGVPISGNDPAACEDEVRAFVRTTID